MAKIDKDGKLIFSKSEKLLDAIMNDIQTTWKRPDLEPLDIEDLLTSINERAKRYFHELRDK